MLSKWLDTLKMMVSSLKSGWGGRTRLLMMSRAELGDPSDFQPASRRHIDYRG